MNRGRLEGGKWSEVMVSAIASGVGIGVAQKLGKVSTAFAGANRPTYRFVNAKGIVRFESHPIRRWFPDWLSYPHWHLDILGKSLSRRHLPLVEPLAAAGALAGNASTSSCNPCRTLSKELMLDLRHFLNNLSSSHVKATADPNVFWISIRLRFLRLGRWRRREEERRRLVDDFRGASKHVYLWLKGWDGEIPASFLGTPWQTGGGAALWEVDESVSSERLLDSLYEGRWLLLFYQESPASITVPEYVERDPHRLIDFVRSVGARVAIVSMEDDVDWLVAFA